MLKTDTLHSLIITCIVALLLSCSNSEEDFTQYVNPFIGTSGTGHTFPGATVPFGLVQLSPQTGNYAWEYCSGYQYKDTLVKGFAHTHLNGTGIGDLGDILMLPFSGKTDTGKMASAFSKSEEKASPGYYTTLLKNDAIKVELSATPHTGIHRYTFQKEGENNILINIDNTLFSWGEPKTKVSEAQFEFENATTISGYLRSSFWVARQVFFTIVFDKPVVSKQFLDSAQRRLVVSFGNKAGQVIEARVAISTVSIEGAKKNLQAESTGKSFSQIREGAVKEWNKYLSLATIEGSYGQKQNFYTSLYHLFIQPNNIADVDGQYRGADDQVYTSSSKAYYSTLSLWDTYRAAHPLYTILVPEKNAEIVQTMLQHFDVQGYLPVWALWGKENHCMIGNHAVPVIVDAYLKGTSGIDGEKAFAAIKESLTKNHWSKYDWTLYDKYGYLPSDTVKTEAVSRTLEASFDDWCAAQLAKALGKTADYEFFSKRAGYYKNVFDSTTLLMRGKNSDGSWVTPFEPLKIAHAGSGDGDYTEGNAWQYTWHVMHDVEGLTGIMGGKDQLAARLDTLFSMDSDVFGDGLTLDVSGLVGQYAHGNEPSHHVIYLYNYAGKPHKVQELVPEVLQSQYKNSPDGLSGNDDCGQMSAWYIFSSLGFYPVNPASGVFDIGVPAFKYAQLNLKGKTFEVKATNYSPENKYVASVKLNGKPLENLQITYQQIMQGGVLEFEMTHDFR